MADCLLINKDGNPVSLLPMSTITWQEAIKYLVLEKGTALSWYDDWIIHSARWETAVPAVIILTEYMKPKNSVTFSKANVFLRDDHKCQYCGVEVNRKTATLDHVLPISHGGKTNYENTVCACMFCNSNKGNNKKIKPKKMPKKPTYWELVEKRKKIPFDIRHPDWALYLS